MPPRSRGAQLFMVLNIVSTNQLTSGRPRLCAACSRNLFGAPSPASNHAFTHFRPFSGTSPVHKKVKPKPAAVKDSPAASTTTVPNNQSQHNRDKEVDPYDFSDLEAGISKALERLKDALSKTRNAGRVSVEMIEALMLELKAEQPVGNEKGGGSPLAAGGHKTKRVRLGDVATVVPKSGRMVQIYAQEEGHVKALAAAVAGSEYSLSATSGNSQTPNDQNPLVLNVPIPPATAETRGQAAAEAKKSLERAMQDIRMVRGDKQKLFRKWELGKLVIKDELVKAHRGMEEVVKRGQGEGEKLYQAALKGLQQ